MNKDTFLSIVELSKQIDDRPKVLRDTVRRPNSFHYYKTFVHLAAAMNPKLIIELGTNQGTGALHFRFGASATARIVTVDNMDRPKIREKMFAHDIDGVLCDAVAYAKQVEDGTVDILFIDTNNGKREESGAYDLLTRELAVWLPKMKSGGIILFDDIRNGEMSKAWDELEGDKLEVKELHAALSFGVLFL